VNRRNSANSGFNWSAVYDGLNRRLQTTQQTVTGGVLTGTALTLKSSYDPEVEFLELAVTSPTARYWKVHGPDLNGKYGGLQGTGGLEAVYNGATGVTTSIMNDTYGSAEVTLTASGSSISYVYNPVAGSGYGSAPGGLAAVPMDATHDLGNVIAWRGHYVDGTGYYYMGMRYYAQDTGEFLSPDLLGHAVCMDLYSYASGDPVNNLDPDGRLATGFATGYVGGAFAKSQNLTQGIGQAVGTLGSYLTPGLGEFALVRDTVGGAMNVGTGMGRMLENGVNWVDALDVAINAVGTVLGVKGMSPQPVSRPPVAVFSDAPAVNLTAFGSNGVEAYQGVKQASQYLRDMGVSRADRVTYLQSFDIRTITVQTAGDANFGIRFHDFGQTARPMGQFLTETFTPLTNRSTMALPVEWNGMTGISQWQIKPGTTMISGQVAPQLQFGAQFTGGANQTFILEPWKYGTLLKP
jgi:RHS repeat-associated protein